MQTILYVTAEILRIIAIMAQPFMPASMEMLLDLLNVPASERTFAHAEIAQGLVAGSSLPAPIPIFPRYIEEAPRAD
jgi:methionyl-tRNA synthetase